MKHENRSRKRGAAMVEAAVVLPLLCLFYGMIMLVHNTGLAALDVQQATRDVAFSNAAHACENLGFESATQRIDPGPIPKEGDAPDREKTMSLDTTPFIETRANSTKVAVALQRSTKVQGRSQVYCNPLLIAYNEPGSAARALRYIAASVQAGMWKMVKFAGWAMGYLGEWTEGFITDGF